MKLVKYSNKYKAELLTMLSNIQDYERSLFPDRAIGKNVAHKWLREFKSKKSEFILLITEYENIKQSVIGFTWCYIKKDILNKRDLRYLEISDLFIKETFRNMGYGEKVLKEIEKIGKKLKVNALTLTFLTKNDRAGRLYKRLGFDDYETSLIKRI